jgi:hypothetical protein
MLTDRFLKHLPLGIDQGEGERMHLAGRDCLYFAQCPARWESEAGQDSSFAYLHWVVLLGPGGPEKLFRAEHHRALASTALCSVERTGRHGYIDELPEDIGRAQFLTIIQGILTEG